MESMACPEGVEDMLTAKPGGIPETIDGMEHSTLNGGATVVLTVAPASRRVWGLGQRPKILMRKHFKFSVLYAFCVLVINVSAMTNRYCENHQIIIVDITDKSIISNSITPLS